MYKIKTLNNISSVGLDVLSKDDYTISGDVEAPDAILVRSAKMHDMTFNPELLCIARAGAGTNNIPCDRCAEEGIVVFNTPGANAESVKELVICAILLASRDIVGGIEWVRSIAGDGEVAASVEKGKSKFVGPEIMGKTLGVIGLGAVGAKAANVADALGMTVYGYDPFLSVDAAWNLSSSVRHASNLETVFRHSDYITIHVPYMDSTHHMINAEAISQMKDGVRIINLARAELVDDDAIKEAIACGKVARYVTDFPNDATANTPGIIAIPHLGASTPESEDNCAVMAAKEIDGYLRTGNIVNAVNMPRASLALTDNTRICVIHKNVPDVIAKITSAISSLGINIENMVNAGNKRFANAYTIIDVSDDADGLKEAIEKVGNVIKVRIIK